MFKRLTAGLGPTQLSIVLAIFILTLTGAIVAAYFFRRHNLRNA